MQMDRVLTLVVKIKDPEKSKAIWDTHLKGELLAGCKVTAIADDDMLEARNKLEGYVNYLEENGLLDTKLLCLEDWMESET